MSTTKHLFDESLAAEARGEIVPRGVCFDCGTPVDSERLVTAWLGRCERCGKMKSVTAARSFRKLGNHAH